MAVLAGDLKLYFLYFIVGNSGPDIAYVDRSLLGPVWTKNDAIVDLSRCPPRLMVHHYIFLSYPVVAY